MVVRGKYEAARMPAVKVVAFDAAGCGDAALADLLRRVYVDEGYADPDAAAESLSARSVRTRGEVLAAVSEDGTALLGTVTIVRQGSPARRFAEPGEAEIHLLAVDPAWRGRGIGRALVDAAVGRARQGGSRRILLWTQPSMTSAHRLYHRCGFARLPSLDFTRADRRFLVFTLSPEPRTVQALIFDMDVLMLDTEPAYQLAWQRAAAGLGYPVSDVLYAELVGRPTADCERVLLERFGGAFPLDAFRIEWPALWHAEVAEAGIPTKPGLAEMLSFARENGLLIAVATSSEADFAEFSLRRAGLDRQFTTIVCGDQVARGKPSPDIYLEAARRLGVSPHLCVALEDSEAGVAAAAAAGMISVLVPHWPPSDPAIKAASVVVPSLHEAREYVRGLLSAPTSSRA